MVLNYLILGWLLFVSLFFVFILFLPSPMRCDFLPAPEAMKNNNNKTAIHQRRLFFSLRRFEFICCIWYSYSVVVQSLFTLDAINKIVFHTNAVLQRRMTEFHFALHKQISRFCLRCLLRCVLFFADARGFVHIHCVSVCALYVTMNDDLWDLSVCFNFSVICARSDSFFLLLPSFHLFRTLFRQFNRMK